MRRRNFLPSFCWPPCERSLCCYAQVWAKSNWFLPCRRCLVAASLFYFAAVILLPIARIDLSDRSIRWVSDAFCWIKLPNTFLFQISGFCLIIWSFCWTPWAAQLCIWNWFRQERIYALKDLCLSHIFLDLKGVGTPCRHSVVNNSGQWSERGLRRRLR